MLALAALGLANEEKPYAASGLCGRIGHCDLVVAMACLPGMSAYRGLSGVNSALFALLIVERSRVGFPIGGQRLGMLTYAVPNSSHGNRLVSARRLRPCR